MGSGALQLSLKALRAVSFISKKCSKMMFELAAIANVTKTCFEENEKDQCQEHITGDLTTLGQGLAN